MIFNCEKRISNFIKVFQFEKKKELELKLIYAYSLLLLQLITLTLMNYKKYLTICSKGYV